MTCTDTENGNTTGAPTLTLDDLFDLLSATQRRRALYFLHEYCDDSAEIEDVIDYIAGTADRASGDVTRAGTDHDAIALDLRHKHLPRLEQAGVVEYDERSGSIRYDPDELLETWLDRAANLEMK